MSELPEDHLLEALVKLSDVDHHLREAQAEEAKSKARIADLESKLRGARSLLSRYLLSDEEYGPRSLHLTEQVRTWLEITDE